MSSLPAEQFQELLLRWRADPVAFVQEAFTGDPSLPPPVPEKWQAEALRAINDHDRLAIRSGHGVGKSCFLAWVILWLLVTRSEIKIPCTANNSSQLHDVLWAEIGKWHRRMLPLLRNMLVVTSDRVMRLHREDQAFAVARTARRENPEAFQGFHSGNLFFLIDEASGVDEVIFQAGRGSMSTEGAKTLMTGNPTRRTGYFHDAFNPKPGKPQRWFTMKVAGFDSSQVTQLSMDEWKEDYGENSNEYRVRVLGEFPKADDDAVIPYDWIAQARSREVERVPAPVIWGVDVARFGSDRSAVAKRMANHLLEPVTSWQGLDIAQTSGRIVAMYETTPNFLKPKEIMVDAIGMGAGVADNLRAEGLPAKAVQVSEKPGIFDRYLRLRDELWFKVREWFQEQDVVMNDEKLAAELSTVSYEITQAGKIRVESKDEMKKRGLRSPDLADAFCLTFAASSRWDRAKRSVPSHVQSLPARTQNRYDPMRW